MDESTIVEAIRALLKPWHVEGEDLTDPHGVLETIADLVFEENV